MLDSFDTKKKIYSSIGGVLFLILSYWTFHYFTKKETVNPWYFVPNSTLITIEANQLSEQLKDKEVAHFFQRFQFLDEITHQYAWLDTVLRSKDYTIHDLLGEKNALVSFHFLPTRNSLESIVYLPILKQDKQFVKALTEFFNDAKNGFFIEKEQLVEGNCWVLRDTIQHTKFHFLIENNVFIGTYSQDLIKQVLKQIQTPVDTLLNQKVAHEEYLNRDEKIKMYVNLPLLLQTFKYYTSDDNQGLVSALELFAEHTFLNVKLENQSVLFHGFTYNTQNSAFLNCFEQQKSTPFQLAPILSNRIISLSYFGISDGEKFKKKLTDYWWNQGIDIQEKFANVQQGKQVDINPLYKEMNGLLAYATLENHNTHAIERVLYFPSQNVQATEQIFYSIAKGTLPSTQEPEKITYQNHEIIALNVIDFPYLLLGEYFSHFGKSYYTKIENYIVIANTPQTLKLLIDDIEHGEIWSRSANRNEDIEQLFSKSNVGLYLNSKKVIQNLSDFLSLEGKTIFDKNKTTLSSLETISLQFTTDKSTVFFTDCGFKVKNTPKKTIVEKEVQQPSKPIKIEVAEQSTEHKIVSKPFVFSDKIMVQDDKNNIILFSKEQKILWKYDAKYPIIGEIFEATIQKKTHYVFATKSEIFCIDSEGKNYKNFPFSIKNSEIKTLSLIDYDGSKKYRLLVSTNKNELRMYDMTTTNLNGWNPQKIQHQLLVPTQHIRVKGKDVILAIEQSGKIHLWNRLGKYMPNFPIDLKTPLQNDIFISKENTIENSTMTFLTQKGEILKYNFKGKQLFSKQLTEKNQVAQLVLSTDKTEYCLVIQKEKQVVFLNNHLKELFLTALINKFDITKTQYYRLTEKESLFINYNDGKAVFHVEKLKGTFIEKELKTTQHIALLYHSKTKKYTIYQVDQNKIVVKEISGFSEL